MNELSIEQTRDMLLAVVDIIVANQTFLTEIDSRIGDGDHGIGMATGMKKAEMALRQGEFQDVPALFKAMGRSMMMSMGGASGIIFGTMFEGGCKQAGEAKTLDASLLRILMRGGLDMVVQRGKAAPGDKTMVDALQPAVTAMESCDTNHLTELLRAAEEAAHAGMMRTKQYVARFGRAKSLMERSIGFEDAGAASVWLIFQGMRSFLETLEQHG